MAEATDRLRARLAERGYRVHRREPRPLHPLRRRRLLHDPASGQCVDPRDRARSRDAEGARRMTDLLLADRPKTAGDFIAVETEYGARNYKPLDVVLTRGRGRLCLGRRRQALPRLPGRLFGREPGPLPPEDPGGDGRPGAAADPDLARLPQRPARALLRRAVRPDPLAHGPADELRRRGGGERPEGGPQVGLSGQGRAEGPGGDHRLRRQLPRPHPGDHRLLHRPRVPRRLRPLRAGVQDRRLTATPRRWRRRSPPTPPPS